MIDAGLPRYSEVAVLSIDTDRPVVLFRGKISMSTTRLGISTYLVFSSGFDWIWLVHTDNGWHLDHYLGSLVDVRVLS